MAKPIYPRNFPSTITLFILSLAIILVYFLIFGWISSLANKEGSPTIQYKELTPREKIEHRKLLTKHGLIGKIAVIEIRASDNTLWYPLRGKIAQLK